MSIKTKAEILQSLSSILGDNNSDEVLELMTDIKDTIDDDSAQTIARLQQEKSELDSSWRTKYRNAFLSEEPQHDPEPEKDDKPKIVKFDDLFTNGGK